jgi:hypothetical protein
MLTQTIRLGVLFALMVVISGCAPKLEEFSPDGKFKVMIPGTPKDDSSSQGVPIKTWSTTERDGTYVVSQVEVSGLAWVGSIDQILEKVTESQAFSAKGQVLKKSSTMLSGKYPGLSVEGWVPSENASYRVRTYVVKSKVYQVYVLGIESFVKSDNATKFLDSLQILAE